MSTYCTCETPLMDVEHDAGCRRCGLPVDFSPRFCEHGVSFAPGEPDAEGRSTWCAECFPPADTFSDLKGRALRAATALYDEHDLDALGPNRGTREVLCTLIAAGWVEGWYAGGQEASRIVRDEIAKMIAGAK